MRLKQNPLWLITYQPSLSWKRSVWCSISKSFTSHCYRHKYRTKKFIRFCTAETSNSISSRKLLFMDLHALFFFFYFGSWTLNKKIERMNEPKKTSNTSVDGGDKCRSHSVIWRTPKSHITHEQRLSIRIYLPLKFTQLLLGCLYYHCFFSGRFCNVINLVAFFLSHTHTRIRNRVDVVVWWNKRAAWTLSEAKYKKFNVGQVTSGGSI